MRGLYVSLLLLVALCGVQVSANAAQNRTTRLEGQVVCCAECWAEADRNVVPFGTAEDLLKAKSCVEGGDPTLIAVKEGERFTLYRLEQGGFKLQGENWLEFVGKRVAVTGTVSRKKDEGVVRVDALEVLAPSPADQEAAKALGSHQDLRLEDLFGVEQNLSAFRGRIVVLNFWATYCAPCRKEMPDLAALQNEYAAFGVQVIGASADAPGDRAKVLQFVKETKINFPVWMGATSADMMRFGLGAALPGTVVVGRDGKIVKIISGVVKLPELKMQIDSILAVDETEAEAASTSKGDETLLESSPSEAAEASEASSVPS